MFSLPVTAFSEHMDAMMARKWLGLAGCHELDRVNSQILEMFIR
ncbi:hypothetical protein TUM17561_45300 [Enterobacter cloacae]|nr:hypothetical protein [Citrobacter freundii]MDV1747366.1 hypothetical protein [Citrobacter freundii]MEB0445145.1 hypothetical protein [Citrobacter freundii]GJK57112.1 hypothetical protein TUM17561_45300 [Enterobacter cloacae]